MVSATSIQKGAKEAEFMRSIHGIHDGTRRMNDEPDASLHIE
jgi:hypothetical protein